MHALVQILLFGASGRLLLSWLPAGLPGRHSPRELPLTCATSFAVGFCAWQVLERAATVYELSRVWLHGSVWIGIGLARLLTLPGGLVPRHCQRSPPAKLRSDLGWCASVLALPLLGWLSHGLAWNAPALLAVCALACGNLLLEAALAVSRKSRGPRRLWLLLQGASVWMLERDCFAAGSQAFLCWALCAYGALAWARRAEERAQYLCWIGGAGASALLGAGAWIAYGALIAIALASPEPSRWATLAKALAVALGALFLLGFPGISLSVRPQLGAGAALLGLGAAALFGSRWPRACSVGEQFRIEPPLRELQVLGALALWLGTASALLHPRAWPGFLGLPVQAVDCTLDWSLLASVGGLAAALLCLPAEQELEPA